MIVVSVVLILVAVTLLVLGVAGGSSTLLISSIAASLLAAIALVAGARQAAAMRRAAAPVPEPLEPDIHAGPGPDLPVAEPVASTSGAETGAGGWTPAGRRRGRRRRDAATPEPSFADNPPASDEGLASPTDTKPRVANREDAEAALAADAAYQAEAAYQAGGGPAPQAGAAPAGAAPAAAAPDGAAPDDLAATDAGTPDADPDYRRASSVIDAARTEDPDENAWRRPPGQREENPRGVAPDADRSGFADGAGTAEEFGEPDADDPDDEPLPQAVRPADAVRVARMSAEVLVVDGRPRYHMADCRHLLGRLTEPLPVGEAVELGFSPCGLCRPVDRLVARAAQL
jgi:hypothetical protein